jgi:hypothetical protein
LQAASQRSKPLANGGYGARIGFKIARSREMALLYAAIFVGIGLLLCGTELLVS